MEPPRLHVGFGTQCGPATLFPVWADAPAVKGLVTGAESQLSVSELPTPQVGRLSVTNQGSKPALLTEGQLLEGGRQHRITARTALIGAGETAEIDVVCVEQGRWNGTTVHRSSGRRAPFHVQAGLHGSGSDRQGDVWQRVQRYEGIRTTSSTGSLVDHLDMPQPHGFLLPNLLDGQRGVIFGFAGQVLSLELFGSHKLFRQHYAALMESVVLDLQLFTSPAGHGTSNQVPAQGARDFIVAVASNGCGFLDVTEHHGGRGATPARRFEGRHPALPVSGLSIGVAGSTEPQIAHLSAWNRRHSVLA